jgi:hypothetical protein
MHRIVKTLVPFSLALVSGLLVTALVNSRLARPEELGRHSTPLKIVSVPETDFSADAKLARGLQASVKLRALFDEDGLVKDVRPYPMIPYGVPESAAGRGEFRDRTSSMVQGRFVDTLPYGLTDVAIKQVKQVRFVPGTVNQTAQCDWVIVLVEFTVQNVQLDWPNCSSIKTTMMDESGVVWQGNTWSHGECVGLAKS